MHFYLVSPKTDRYLAKSMLDYTDRLSEAAWFYTWEEAYAVNMEDFSGQLNEVSEEDL